METARFRFLRYVTYYTTSDEHTGASPSTERQKDLGRVLLAELEESGSCRMPTWTAPATSSPPCRRADARHRAGAGSHRPHGHRARRCLRRECDAPHRSV